MKIKVVLLILFSWLVTNCIKPQCPLPQNGPEGQITPASVSISSWSLKVNGISGSLIAVDFPTATTGYIGGSNGVAYKTVDGGESYQNISPLPGYDSYTLDFVSENVGYLATTVTSGDGKIYKTVNGAQNWQELTSLPAHLWRIVKFLDANTGFAGGGIINDIPQYDGKLFRTADGGATWTEIILPGLKTVRNIVFLDQNNGFLCSQQAKVYKTTDGGLTWVPKDLNIATSIPTYQLVPVGLYFKNVNEGYCLVNTFVYDDFFLMKTTNGGDTWSRVALPASGYSTSDFYYSIVFSNSNTGYISGGNVGANTGTLLKTTDGGNTWTRMPISSPRLTQMYLVNDTTAYAVGGGGTVLKSN